MTQEAKIPFNIFNAVPLAAERTSSPIGCEDADTLVIAYNYGGAGAATNLFFRVDWYLSRADADGSVAARTFTMLGGSVALNGTDAIETLEPYKALRTTGSADKGIFSVPCLAPFCRVRIDGDSGDASDIVSAWAILIKK